MLVDSMRGNPDVILLTSAPSRGGFDPRLIHSSLGPHESTNPHLKRNLDRFSCFCRAHDRDRQTDRQTDNVTPSMYSLTFCVRVLLPERHQWKPAVQAAAVMLKNAPRRRPITGEPATPTSHIRRAILRTPPSPASQRPAARADPAQPAVRTMSSYRGMDASL